MSIISKPLADPVYDPRLLGIFGNHLPTRARILNLAGDQRHWFQRHQYEIETVATTQDLRLLSLKKESLDGIWSHLTLEHLSIEECHRVLGSFFMGLKPGTGILFISISENRHPENAFLSLLRQSGFQLIEKGKSPDSLAFLLRRA